MMTTPVASSTGPYATLIGPFRSSLILAIGMLALILPTMIDVARTSWSTEQGAHGPIVLVTGIWLLWGELHRAPVATRPGSTSLVAALLAPLLVVFTVARISGIIEIEGLAMFATVIVVAYGLWGPEPLRRVWFPLIYLLFVFPPPDTLFTMVTQPLKIAVSQTAVFLLGLLGYPIAGSGVTIQIGQYQMLIAAACAGLNSLLSLTALGLFYTYLRHKSELAYMVVLVCFILPVAVLANLVRVVLLLLITYHFGEAAGQGFFHELAGLTMFTVALLTIFVVDWLAAPLRNRLARPNARPNARTPAVTPARTPARPGAKA
jgi:exosortase